MNNFLAVSVAALVVGANAQEWEEPCATEASACRATAECSAIMSSIRPSCGGEPCQVNYSYDPVYEPDGTCSGGADCTFTAAVPMDEYVDNLLANAEGRVYANCMGITCPQDDTRKSDPIVGACRADEACWNIVTSDAMERDADGQNTQAQVYDSGWCVSWAAASPSTAPPT